MHIEELTSKPNIKIATVVMTYEEVRDIANGLYHLISGTECNKDDYKNIYAKSKFLFDMVKHGMIQPETLNRFDELN